MSTHAQILAVYSSFDSDYPGMSTEMLLQLTADACRCDVSDVFEALERAGVELHIVE